MRNLTIFRAKCSVDAVARMRIFIEDSEDPDVTINGVGCRKLGVLKNGEERSFEIGEQCARVFVIADRDSTKDCSSFCTIPAGFADVRLTGRVRREPGAGSVFRFDDAAQEQQLRKKRFKRLCVAVLLSILGIAAAVGGFFGVRALLAERVKDFTAEGMTITLTNRFARANVPGFLVSYVSDYAAIHALREDFSGDKRFDGLTAEEYAALIAQGNEQLRTAPKTDGGLCYYEYEYQDSEDKPISYLVAVYKGPDAFWVVNFAAEQESYAALRQTILQWAHSVRFRQ